MENSVTQSPTHAQPPFGLLTIDEQLDEFTRRLEGDDHSVSSPARTISSNGFTDWPSYIQRAETSTTQNPLCGRIKKGALFISVAALTLMNIAFYGYHLIAFVNKDGSDFRNQTLSLVENYKFNNINETAFQSSFSNDLQHYQEQTGLLYAERMFINAFAIVSLALTIIPTPQRFAAGFKSIKVLTGIGMFAAGAFNVTKHFLFASPLFMCAGLCLTADAISYKSIKELPTKLKQCCSRMTHCFRSTHN